MYKAKSKSTKDYLCKSLLVARLLPLKSVSPSFFSSVAIFFFQLSARWSSWLAMRSHVILKKTLIFSSQTCTPHKTCPVREAHRELGPLRESYFLPTTPGPFWDTVAQSKSCLSVSLLPTMLEPLHIKWYDALHCNRYWESSVHTEISSIFFSFLNV